MKRLLYKNFTWWISNDPSKWWIWSVKYAEWVEVKTDSWKVTLSKGTHSINKLSDSDWVLAYEIYSSTKFLRLHKSGKVTNLTLNNVDDDEYVVALDWVWRNMGSFTTINWHKGFIFTSSKLYQWDYDSSDFTLWLIDWTISQSFSFSEKSPYIIEQNFIYVWNGNKITWIDATWTWLWLIEDACSIDLDFTIKWITHIWDQIFIYASNWNSSRQYLWDWVTETPLRWIPWIDKNIVNVANFANEDYVITQNQYSYKTWLWKVAWYQLLKIYTNEENNNASNERIYFESNYTNAIETVWDNLLIPWANWIYTFWNHTPWLPFALVKEYLHNGWEVTAISFNANNSNRITFAYDWTINWVFWAYETIISITDWYATRTDLAWFIEIHNIEWEALSNKKDIEKILVWYKLPTNTKINVYTKKEDRTIKYANIPYQYTTIPTIWAVYTFSGNTYTIYAVTDMWNNSCILHTTYTWTGTWSAWTFTKTSWTWDATFYCEKVRYWFKLIKTITDTTIRREQILTSEPFFELSVWIELLSWNSSVTPELNNFYVYFNETEDV